MFLCFLSSQFWCFATHWIQVSFDTDPKCASLQFRRVCSHFIHSRYGGWSVHLPLWGFCVLTWGFILISPLQLLFFKLNPSSFIFPSSHHFCFPNPSTSLLDGSSWKPPHCPMACPALPCFPHCWPCFGSGLSSADGHVLGLSYLTISLHTGPHWPQLAAAVEHFPCLPRLVQVPTVSHLLASLTQLMRSPNSMFCPGQTVKTVIVVTVAQNKSSPNVYRYVPPAWQ